MDLSNQTIQHTLDKAFSSLSIPSQVRYWQDEIREAGIEAFSKPINPKMQVKACRNRMIDELRREMRRSGNHMETPKKFKDRLSSIDNKRHNW
tara:strand:+ start:858 stop:1136 length:279 start_codon:yes stop_codon:yes gene_type:complete